MKCFLALVFSLSIASAAYAQSDMSCADLIKNSKQIDDATKGMPKDAESAALDKKINDYCVKNPSAKVSEAMEKAMAD